MFLFYISSFHSHGEKHRILNLRTRIESEKHDVMQMRNMSKSFFVMKHKSM